MLKVPEAAEVARLPGGRDAYLMWIKNMGCIGCHQLGQESTRTIPGAFGKFDSGEAAWMRRVQSGQSGEQMINQLAGNFGGVPFKYLGDWTDRVPKPNRRVRKVSNAIS